MDGWTWATPSADDGKSDARCGGGTRVERGSPRGAAGRASDAGTLQARPTAFVGRRPTCWGRMPEALPGEGSATSSAGPGCTWHSSPWRSPGVLGVTVALTPSSFMRGLIVGLGVAGTAGALWLWIVEATGTAPTRMGDLGEQWTAKELRRLRRSGWQVVNHVTLTAPDIDHVLVGPGGMFAIETKWSATTWTVDDPRIRSAAESACRNARLLGLWQNLKPAHVGQVRPVVFLWGAGAGELPESFEVAGATVVPGPRSEGMASAVGSRSVGCWTRSRKPGVPWTHTAASGTRSSRASTPCRCRCGSGPSAWSSP